MSGLDILQTGFIAFIDGLWWGLRENTGPLSMYDGYRGGFKQMGEEIAAKLPVKLMFPCLLFIFPTIFIVILGPAAIQIYKTLLTQ